MRRDVSHRAFYVDDQVNKRLLLNSILGGSINSLNHFKTSDIGVFSDYFIRNLIYKELFHDIYPLCHLSQQPLHAMSNGEQKKVVLKYLLEKPIKVLIVDNPFDYIDDSSREALAQKIKDFSSSCMLIQLFSRKEDLFDFIAKVSFYRNKKWKTVSRKQFISFTKIQRPKFNLSLPIPVSPNKMEDNETLVQLKNVNVSYRDSPILNNISWTIKQGDFWQLEGDNGTGKSTLLSMITGDNPKGYGQDITLFGYKKGAGESVWDIKKHIGYFRPSFPQRFSKHQFVIEVLIGGFFDSFGLYENLTNYHRSMAQKWLKLLNMELLEQESYVDVTEAQQRLLMISRAMIKMPNLLILDEPTSGLSDVAAELVKDLIIKISNQSDVAIICVSHRNENFKAKHLYRLQPSPSGSLGKELK